MTYDEIRKVFLEFFEAKGHKIVPSASLIPHDPSVMFTIAGMVPFKNVFLGQEKPVSLRVADVQKCVRAGGKHNDLEEVGISPRHHTFFEMLGNWSFGDYFKKEAISYSWELLTKVLNIDPKRLTVTVHKTDDESAKLWHEIAGIPDEEIIRLDKDNWWSMGDIGPCGPCTEIFYDFGEHLFGGKPGTKDEDGPRYAEIWNNVFMQYNRDENGELHLLPKPCVDTGAGLERWACMLQGVCDNYDTDLFVSLRNEISKITGVSENKDNKSCFKVISDHIRSVGFLIADGVMPSNEGRGYVVRRLIRRAMRFANLMGYNKPVMSKLYLKLVDLMGDAYPELMEQKDRVIKIIEHEETSFFNMLIKGNKLLDEEIKSVKNNVISGKIAFKLYDTYGFPLDLTELILREHNIRVDLKEYDECMKEQQERSKANWKGKAEQSKLLEVLNGLDVESQFVGYDILNTKSKVLKILECGTCEFVNQTQKGKAYVLILDKTPFYSTCGGQIFDVGTINNNEIENVIKINKIIAHFIVMSEDKQISENDIIDAKVDAEIRKQISNAHTATHLLQKALQTVLGNEVSQKGSEVHPESVRFDFNHISGMTEEQLIETENLINSWIRNNIKIYKQEMPIEEAKKLGAMALFGEKYGNVVRVVSIGSFDNPVSMEFCAGTHTDYTGDIGFVKIISETSIASGIRRINMLTGSSALMYVQKQEKILNNVVLKLNTTENNLVEKISNLQETVRLLEIQNADFQMKLFLNELKIPELEKNKQISMILNNVDVKNMKQVAGYILSKSGAKILCLVINNAEKVILAIASDGSLDVRPIIKELIGIIGGSGAGGTSNYAQGGGNNSAKIKELINKFNSLIEE